MTTLAHDSEAWRELIDLAALARRMEEEGLLLERVRAEGLSTGARVRRGAHLRTVDPRAR